MDSGESYRDQTGTIVGVVSDAHFRSLHHRVDPTILFPETSWRNFFSIRIDATDVTGALSHVERAWNEAVPALPFQWTFLDESLTKAYRAEERLGKAMGVFALLAVLITCLGVFGLASFATARRKKEIGARKVAGASTRRIVLLLSVEPLKLGLVASVIATPLTWVAMEEWLQAFAYRVQLGPPVFAFGAAMVLAVAWLAVAPIALRAARTNPAEALRHE